jgi:hypothetical protein
MLKKLFFTGLLWCFLISFAFGATYYISPTGSDITGNGSPNNPWATFSKGISSISGGDTLIAKSGIYKGNSNRIVNPPSGSAKAYTKIQAEADWGVTISGTTQTTCQIDKSHNYIEVRGLKFKNPFVNKCIIYGNYIKVIRCASDGAPGNGSSFSGGGSYNLFEECYAWGQGRYPIRTCKPGQYIIFRRCVVRWDYSNTDEPQSCFANYDCPNVYFQNCIAIDGVDNRGQDVEYDGLKGFFTPNGANETHYEGCISLNMEGTGFFIEDSPVSNVTLTNCVAWASKNHVNAGTDGYPPRAFYGRQGDGPLTINHCTFGGSDWTGNGVSVRSDLNNSTIKNSILANFTALSSDAYAESDFDTSDYNDYYGNAGRRNRKGRIGAHSFTINPFAKSLKYLLRIENKSHLDGRANDGGDIGATILKKIGVSGTLYGEAGWNTVTDENLWPFPNEDEMRADMRAFYAAPGEAYTGSPEMRGDRGFCADGQTLTKYIWEYLGNTIPAEIYLEK